VLLTYASWIHVCLCSQTGVEHDYSFSRHVIATSKNMQSEATGLSLHVSTAKDQLVTDPFIRPKWFSLDPYTSRKRARIIHDSNTAGVIKPRGREDVEESEDGDGDDATSLDAIKRKHLADRTLLTEELKDTYGTLSNVISGGDSGSGMRSTTTSSTTTSSSSSTNISSGRLHSSSSNNNNNNESEGQSQRKFQAQPPRDDQHQRVEGRETEAVPVDRGMQAVEVLPIPTVSCNVCIFVCLTVLDSVAC
jgi:hypothetical protein